MGTIKKKNLNCILKVAGNATRVPQTPVMHIRDRQVTGKVTPILDCSLQLLHSDFKPSEREWPNLYSSAHAREASHSEGLFLWVIILFLVQVQGTFCTFYLFICQQSFLSDIISETECELCPK